MTASVNLEKLGKPVWVIVGGTFLLLLGTVDYLTGHELSFSLFYVLPIALVAWFISPWLGGVISIISAFVWLGVDIATGESYSHPAIYYWNTLVRLGFFFLVTLLLALKRSLEREKELARTDYLTGAVNTRFFFDLAQMELNRSHRYKRPFTIAYIDLDNFKMVNDHFGHTTGDKVLCTVVSSIRQHLRKTDIVARLGGDEFVLLLPETGKEAAQVAISKLRLSLLDEMQQNNWPVTFSIGVLICLESPRTLDEVIKMADALMYSVKNNAKNGISYSIHVG